LRIVASLGRADKPDAAPDLYLLADWRLLVGKPNFVSVAEPKDDLV
jgi:hypothetical protein